MGAFESALAAAEDETDVQAAKTAKAEAAAELAEFDENIPIEDGEGGEELSKAEQEVALLMKQVSIDARIPFFVILSGSPLLKGRNVASLFNFLI